MSKKVCRKYKECEYYDVTKCLLNDKYKYNSHVSCFHESYFYEVVDFNPYSIDPKQILNKIFGSE